MGFADQIRAFEQKALLAANTSCVKVVETLFTEAVVNSPTAPEAKWAKGLLINSWYPSIGGYDNTVGSSTDYYGSASLSRIKTTLSSLPFFGKDNVITLTNSLDYAYRADKVGWPKNDPTNSTGWKWENDVQAYHFVNTAINNTRGKYM